MAFRSASRHREPGAAVSVIEGVAAMVALTALVAGLCSVVALAIVRAVLMLVG